MGPLAAKRLRACLVLPWDKMIGVVVGFQPVLVCSQGQPQDLMENRCCPSLTPFKAAPRGSEDALGQEEATGKYSAD